MYQIHFFDEARAAAAELPGDGLKALAELLDLLAVHPYTGRLYAGPGSDLRTIAVADGRLLAVWLVLEQQQVVEILRLLWIGDPAAADF